ncbi:hypothetical protein AAG906_029572 [Vitis piasezkii]
MGKRKNEMRENSINSFHYSPLETCRLVGMIYKMKFTKPLCIFVCKKDPKIVMDLPALTTNEVTHHKIPSIYTNKVTHIYYCSDVIFIDTGEVRVHHLNLESIAFYSNLGTSEAPLKEVWSMHWNHDAEGQIPEFLFTSRT